MAKISTDTDPDEESWARLLASPRLVVIAGSAGCLDALTRLLATLPPGFPAAVAVVQHRALDHPELLVQLLGRHSGLPVRHARDGEPLQAGTVYVCPPGMHMMTECCVRLIEGPRLRSVRPNVDLMLRSVALNYAERAVGVVLSGHGSDGAKGCLAIARAGGTVLVQDADSCEYHDMPAAVAAIGVRAQSLPPERIGAVLQQLVATPARRRLPDR